MMREGDEFRSVKWEEAIALIGRRLTDIGAQGGGDALAGLGGACSTNEGAYRFGVFVRSVLGSNNLDCRIHPRDVNQTEVQVTGLGAIGGFGSFVLNYANSMNYKGKIKILGIGDEFVNQGSRSDLLQACGLSSKDVINNILND